MRRTDQARKYDGEDHVAAFAAWFEQRLTALGYDISSPRSGGRGRFATDAGVSNSTVSRILTGQKIPTPDVLATMAPHLRVSLGDLLVLAGKATREEIEQAAAPPPAFRSSTPEEIAAHLGIHDPDLVAFFVTMTKQMQTQQAERHRSTAAGDN